MYFTRVVLPLKGRADGDGRPASQLFIRAGLLKILGILAGEGLLTTQEKTDDYRVEIIKNSLAYIHEHYQEKFYIHDLARQAGMNEQYFCRFFKKAIGRTPVTYINEYRIGRAITLLQDTELPVMDICLDCGSTILGIFFGSSVRRPAPHLCSTEKLPQRKVIIS